MLSMKSERRGVKMNDVIIYNELLGNKVSLVYDGIDYEVRLNNEIVATTGDETEAEIIAESLDVALSVLVNKNLLKENK